MKTKSLIIFSLFFLLASCGELSTTDSLNEETTSSPTSSLTTTSVDKKLYIKVVKQYLGYSPTKIETYINNVLTNNLNLYYEIMDESICKIENGFVDGFKIGTTTVFASLEDGTEASFEVFINDPAEYIFDRDVRSRLEDFERNGNYANPTLFIGDSFFDEHNFWNSFYQDFSESKKCITVGISSSKTTDWLMFRDKLIFNLNPKNLIIHLGTNDVNDSTINKTPEEYYLQITTFLDYVVEALPNVPIYYFGIENRTATSGYGSKNPYVEIVTAKLKDEYAQRYSNFTYIDSPAIFNANQNKYIRADGIHPSADGYAYYVDVLNNLVNF